VHFEAVSEAIAPLIDDELIDEILYPVKSGKEATQWTNHEFEALRVLARAGSNVPRPLGRSAGALAMEWIGDADGPAPQLKEVRLSFLEAEPLFRQLIGEVELWLACNVVHGDLSAYNILFDGQRLVTIDFPQACDPRMNGNAPMLLARDLDNVCRHLARFGIEADGAAIADDLWQRFERGTL